MLTSSFTKNRLTDRTLALMFFSLMCLPLTLLSGCSDGRPARVNVSGTVLIDGEPLKAGNIKFVPEGQRPSTARLNAEGKYTMTCFDGEDGVIPGKHRVQVSAFETLKGSKIRWLAPPRYADFRTSGLSYEISEPNDDLTIELTWGGGKPFVK